MNLTNVTFDASGDPLVATFTWAGPIPQRGPVLWQVTLTSGDGQTIRFLGYKIVDGQHAAHFVFDFGGAWQANPAPDVDLGPNRLVARFSPLALAGIGEQWTWHAVLSVDGTDVSTFQP